MEIKNIDIIGVGLCCLQNHLLEPFGIISSKLDRSSLPTRIRRRASMTTCMAVTAANAACEQAQVDSSTLTSIFASVGGEMQVSDQLCRTLTDLEALISPTQFHNSVHNTTAGYWSMLNRCHDPSTAISGGYEDHFVMALLEVWSQICALEAGPLLLVCYDEQWPNYLVSPPLGEMALACALVFHLGADNGNCLATMSYPQRFTSDEYALSSPLLKIIRQAPAAMTIPLVMALQQGCVFEKVPLSLDPDGWYTILNSRTGQNKLFRPK